MNKEDLEILRMLLVEFRDKEKPGEMLRAYINGVVDVINVDPRMQQG